ncbi:MAG: helix-turn-helix domain-containing protein [Chryseolinea sp.]
MIIKGEEFVFHLNDKQYHCAMDITMDFIGGKWKSVVLWYLINKTLRFTEIKKRIPDMTEKMLSIQLKALEIDGLIKREVSGTKAPFKVEYSLTEFGKTIIPVLKGIAKWGRDLGTSKGKMVSKSRHKSIAK